MSGNIQQCCCGSSGECVSNSSTWTCASNPPSTYGPEFTYKYRDRAEMDYSIQRDVVMNPTYPGFETKTFVDQDIKFSQALIDHTSVHKGASLRQTGFNFIANSYVASGPYGDREDQPAPLGLSHGDGNFDFAQDDLSAGMTFSYYNKDDGGSPFNYLPTHVTQILNAPSTNFAWEYTRETTRHSFGDDSDPTYGIKQATLTVYEPSVLYKLVPTGLTPDNDGPSSSNRASWSWMKDGAITESRVCGPSAIDLRCETKFDALDIWCRVQYKSRLRIVTTNYDWNDQVTSSSDVTYDTDNSGDTTPFGNWHKLSGGYVHLGTQQNCASISDMDPTRYMTSNPGVFDRVRSVYPDINYPAFRLVSSGPLLPRGVPEGTSIDSSASIGNPGFPGNAEFDPVEWLDANSNDPDHPLVGFDACALKAADGDDVSWPYFRSKQINTTQAA